LDGGCLDNLTIEKLIHGYNEIESRDEIVRDKRKPLHWKMKARYAQSIALHGYVNGEDNDKWVIRYLESLEIYLKMKSIDWSVCQDTLFFGIIISSEELINSGLRFAKMIEHRDMTIINMIKYTEALIQGHKNNAEIYANHGRIDMDDPYMDCIYRNYPDIARSIINNDDTQFKKGIDVLVENWYEVKHLKKIFPICIEEHVFRRLYIMNESD